MERDEDSARVATSIHVFVCLFRPGPWSFRAELHPPRSALVQFSDCIAARRYSVGIVVVNPAHLGRRSVARFHPSSPAEIFGGVGIGGDRPGIRPLLLVRSLGMVLSSRRRRLDG